MSITQHTLRDFSDDVAAVERVINQQDGPVVLVGHSYGYKSLIKGNDGFDYVDPVRFPEDFAADLPKQKAIFMANAQVPTADKVFGAVVERAAWKYKPSWYMVATADRIINPDLERMYAKRANSTMIEISGASHAVYASRPIEVAQLIIDASNSSGNR